MHCEAMISDKTINLEIIGRNDETEIATWFANFYWIEFHVQNAQARNDVTSGYGGFYFIYKKKFTVVYLFIQSNNYTL